MKYVSVKLEIGGGYQPLLKTSHLCDKVEEMKRMEPQLNFGTLELGERGFLQQKKKKNTE